jgi:hypothetical protein
MYPGFCNTDFTSPALALTEARAKAGLLRRNDVKASRSIQRTHDSSTVISLLCKEPGSDHVHSHI